MDEDASDASRGSDRERSRYSAQERVLTHSSGPCAPVFVRCNLRLRDRESNRPARSGRDRWPPPRFPRHHSGLGTTQASEYVACTWTNASSACLPFRSVRLGATKPKPQVTGPFRPSWIIDQDAQTTRSSRICPAAGTSSSRSGADRSAEHRSRPEAAPTQHDQYRPHTGRQIFLDSVKGLTLEEALDSRVGTARWSRLIKHTVGWTAVEYEFADRSRDHAFAHCAAGLDAWATKPVMLRVNYRPG